MNVVFNFFLGDCFNFRFLLELDTLGKVWYFGNEIDDRRVIFLFDFRFRKFLSYN